jgi:hypothetical protein
MVDKLIIESSKWDKNKLEENKDFFNNEFVQKDLEKIMWNFLTDNEWQSLTEVFQNWWVEASKKIETSLNLAFEMEVNTVLENKMNYDTEKVDKLLLKLQEWNPFDKLVAFEDIKMHVNTSESIWSKLDKSFQKVSKWAEKEKLTIQDRFENVKYMIDIWKELNDMNILQEAEMDLLSIKEEVPSWEIFEWWDIDILLQEVQEILKEQA